MTEVRTAPLSGDELAAFARDGYVVLGPIVAGDHLTALLAAEKRFRPRHGFAFPGTESGLLVREQLCERSEAVRRFCTTGVHLAAVAQVLGPDVAFTHTQFITKLPDETDGGEVSPSSIPLHQDDGYGRLDPPLDVTVWTALCDTDEHNGCLVVVPGSHRRGLLDHTPAEHNVALQGVAADGAVPVPLPAGHAVLFTGCTLHGSLPNRSGAVRVGLHARYCHPGVRMATTGGRPVLDDAHSWMVLGEAPSQARGEEAAAARVAAGWP